MLKVATEGSGDGGFTIDASAVPAWMKDHSEKFSFAMWVHRLEDQGTNRFRTLFSFYVDNNNYYLVRQSSTSFAVRLRNDNVTHEFKKDTSASNNLGIAANSGNDDWTLVVGYWDPTGTNVRSRIWGLKKNDDDASAVDQSIDLVNSSPPLSSAMTAWTDLQYGRSLAHAGSNLWFGSMGGIVFWKGIEVDADDVQAIWDAKNLQPWTMPASGNLPGPDHDGIFALPCCPMGNPGARGGSNTTGPMMGDVLDAPEDVIVFRQETGVTDTGSPNKYETSTTFPASPGEDTIFTNGFRSDPS